MGDELNSDPWLEAERLRVERDRLRSIVSVLRIACEGIVERCNDSDEVRLIARGALVAAEVMQGDASHPCCRCSKPSFIYVEFFSDWFCRQCAEMLDA